MNFRYLFLGVLFVSVLLCGFVIFAPSDWRPGSDFLAGSGPDAAGAGKSPLIDSLRSAAGSIGPFASADSPEGSAPGQTEVMAEHYRNPQDPGTLPTEEIAGMYGFDRLKATNGKLDLNHKTRVIIEDFLNTVSKDSAQEQMPRIEEALRARLGDKPAKEAVRLIGNFLTFKDSVAAIDRDLNERGVTPDQFSRTEMIETRNKLQEKAFGAADASLLFKVEREAYAVMERQAKEINGPTANLSPEQIEKMQAEYAAILKQEEGL